MVNKGQRREVPKNRQSKEDFKGVGEIIVYDTVMVDIYI